MNRGKGGKRPDCIAMQDRSFLFYERDNPKIVLLMA